MACTDDLNLNEFIENYKLNQIGAQLKKEEITVKLLQNVCCEDIDDLTQALTPNRIQQIKLKHAIMDLQQNKQIHSVTDNDMKRGNPFANETVSNPKKRKIHISNDSNPQNETSNNASNERNESNQACSVCGVSMSVFLIDNHQRHCLKNYHTSESEIENESNHAFSDGEEELQSPVPILPSQPIKKQSLIECKYCQFECDIKAIESHELYCGARTDFCKLCKTRDTFENFILNTHKCNTNTNTNSNPATLDNSEPSLNDSNTDAMEREYIPKFERIINDLRRIFYDRFVNMSSNFEEFDHFGFKKKTENGKSKTELKQEYTQEYKKILNLLIKILENIRNEPSNDKYKRLKCNHTKLKKWFCFSPFCEFLLYCHFEHKRDIYEMSNVNRARLGMALTVLGKAKNGFENVLTMESETQKHRQRNQAIEKNKNSPFYGSWSCAICNHLNRKKTLRCKGCKTKQFVAKKKVKRDLRLSANTWICTCKNRNAMEFAFCEICTKSRFRQ